MKTTLELLRERLLKDKEIFPHYNEYINGILYDIDNELLAMEKEQIKDALQEFLDITLPDEVCEKYYNETFKSE